MGTFSYQGMTCELNCDECEECLFEEKNYNLNMEKIDLEAITSCNDCPYSQCREAGSYGGNLYNWYCNTEHVKRIIDMSVLANKTLEVPKWCPMGCYRNVKLEEKPTKKILTYAEKRELWESIPLICKWEDIKISDVFHVPPVLDEKRKDVLITNVSDFSFQYRLIDKDKKCTSQATYTVYKSAIWWKFMVKHKIIKIKSAKAK